MEPKKENAVDEFFQGLPDEDKAQANIFDDKKDDAPTKEKVLAEQDEDPEKVPESIKDRRHRRLEEKLQKERESNIALNERLKAATEAKRVSSDEGIDERLLEVFGTTDVGKQIAQKFTGLLESVKQSAKEEALTQLQERENALVQEEKQYSDFIDTQLEALEEAHNVDLTSQNPQAQKARREFLEMVERLSPKDDEGNLEAYADFNSTFELYKNSQVNRSADRQKQIASKSMQRSSSSQQQAPQITSGFRGWERDLGLN